LGAAEEQIRMVIKMNIGDSNIEQNKKLKIFISYSHEDNSDEKLYIKQFNKHIVPLKYLIEIWDDCKILPGEDYQNKIDNNLEDADIVCLFISPNFLYSDSCIKEKEKSLELKKQKGIVIIPIILSNCAWMDDKDLSKLLALPTDGNPVSNFKNIDDAWCDVYNGLKKVIEKEMKNKQLEITEKFENFLKDTEILAKAHSQKENVFLEDIFIYPELDIHDNLKKDEKKTTIISSKELLKDILKHSKIVIAGENQSGKTTLCKIIFKELRNNNFIPIYVSGEKINSSGKIEKKISKSFDEQYEKIDLNNIDKERIVPIIDDFHYSKNKENRIEKLSIYSRCIIIVDDIFGLNIKDEKLIGSFDHFKIRELKPSLRNELIKKWINLTDKEYKENSIYEDIDKKTETVESILGNTIGKGIMPAYPFFILSIIFTYETSTTPLQEMTSQGHCYEAFIYFYLLKNGVKPDEADTYINFLTEFAYHIYKEKKDELSPDEFKSFIKSYLNKFNLPIKQNVLLKNLNLIVSKDSFNNYSFQQRYFYFFFAAKYLADYNNENDEIKTDITNIIKNLHVEENAYIAIFIAHHSRNIEILNEIKNNSLDLFNEYKVATLVKDEVKFFDEHLKYIIDESVLHSNTTPEKERDKRLKNQDEAEQFQNEAEQKDNDEDHLVGKELRLAIKTVEVMGSIIKNRSGSLEKTKLNEMFENAMNVYLKILSSLFEYMKSEYYQKYIIDTISKILRKNIEKEEGIKVSDESLKKRAKIIFWNLNFFIVYGIINKIIHSLGSDKLIEIIKKVCDEINTPASFLVKHGILMWYTKNIDSNEIKKKINEKDFSDIAEKNIKFMIINFCSMHQINYKDRQRIETKLKIERKYLITSHKES